MSIDSFERIQKIVSDGQTIYTIDHRGKTPMWILRVVTAFICILIPLLGAFLTWDSISLKGWIALLVCVCFGVLFLIHNLNKSTEHQSIQINQDYIQLNKFRLINSFHQTIKIGELKQLEIEDYFVKNPFNWFSNFYYHNDLGEDGPITGIVFKNLNQHFSMFEYASKQDKKLLLKELKGVLESNLT